MLNLSIVPTFSWVAGGYVSDDDYAEEDNPGGQSLWKPTRKTRNSGLKGKTFKHPLNVRPYTC